MADVRQRFWRKVSQTNGCWKWTAALDPQGYGRFSFRGQNVKAHRVSWEIHYGSIPVDACVLHRCDNPPCVRPDHLFLGTRQENNIDKTNKGRGAKGTSLPVAKLNPEAVKKIRSLASAGRKQTSIARRFGVSRTTICEVVSRKVWRHVE